MIVATESNASNKASLPDAIKGSELVFFPTKRKYKPRAIFTTIAKAMTIIET